ncbi:MAG: AAA family ATPase [Sulfuritalea sp.]|nr:AAA family ATPase [Sulfuritalea sp.]
MFRFEKLEVVHWDYWQRVELPLDANIVTIVGPNGSGKTTLLDALRTLLALDCSGQGSRRRDYKRYVRRNGEDWAWLRAVVDNRKLPNGRRPFWPPHQEDAVTLACRIEKKGGDWSRTYFIAAADVPIEHIEKQGQAYGVRDWRQLMQQAGLTPALAKVLSLEQGQTDKLCELSPKELLDLVFQVFGDKETLDRYAEARNHQDAVARELVEMERELARIGSLLERQEGKVNRYLEWSQLRNERQALSSEIRPRLEYHLLGESIRGARSMLSGARREWQVKRLERAHKRERKVELDAALTAARSRKEAADENDRIANTAASDAGITRTRWATRLEARTRLIEAAKQAGGDPTTDQQALEAAERERTCLKEQLSPLEKEAKETREMLEHLACGRRADPADVMAFRRALDDAGISHDLLAELVEVVDSGWQTAVEAVLAPFAHVVLLAREQDATAAFALGEKMRYRHFVVPERALPPTASPGSLLEVVKFAHPVPEWITRLLDRIRRIEDAHVGARLPRGQDWVTRQGYLRERRGGRHAAGGSAQFGAARLADIKKRLAELERQAQPLQKRIDEPENTIGALRLKLGGVDAGKELAARAEEFARAESELAKAIATHDEAIAAVNTARDNRAGAESAHAEALRRCGENDGDIDKLARDIASLENRDARREQCQRLLNWRRHTASLAPAWRVAEANQRLAEKWESLKAIDRRVEEIERRFETESWETDEAVVLMRDKLKDDYQRQEQEVAERRRDNDMARSQTDSARHEYVKVLRHTAGRYAKNLRQLGEMAGVKVEAEPPPLAADDASLNQAGLTVRFAFDDKGFAGLNDSDASGGQQVVKSLILLVALMMEESRPGGFVFVDEPFAHLDIVNIERVSAFLKATRAQYLLTTPVTHNVGVYDPAFITLVTSKKRPNETWAPRIGVVVRTREA